MGFFAIAHCQFNAGRKLQELNLEEPASPRASGPASRHAKIDVLFCVYDRFAWTVYRHAI
jgi:hypothetical protein